MNSTASNPPPPPGEGSGKKVRKPYTITKSRESWTDEEHDKFIEALQMFDRDWKKIEDFIGSKTVIQIRSHAQKYFLKVQKNGTVAHVPPPRPKRKATHPYPQKAPKNVLLPLQATVAYLTSAVNSYVPWNDASALINNPSNDFDHLEVEADIGSKGDERINHCSVSGVGSSPIIQGLPDFSEVYSFIGSVFDPECKDHVEKLKEMDPINFETVLLLTRNLSINLSNPDFEPIRKALSSYDVATKTVGVSAIIGTDQRPTIYSKNL